MEVNNASDNSVTGSTAGQMPTDGTGTFYSSNYSIFTLRLTLLSGVVELDPWLGPFKEPLRHRYKLAQDWIKTIEETEGGLEKFSRVSSLCSASQSRYPLIIIQGYEQLGFHVLENNDITYREWAPNALRAYLIGDFSKISDSTFYCHIIADLNFLDGWNRDSHEMKKNAFGVFEITVPAKDGQPAIPHDSKIKVREKRLAGMDLANMNRSPW
jgi:1,4-alpha-glucan branching enzyme